MIPQTSKESHEKKSGKVMGWGLHLAKISEVKPGEKANGIPIVDKNGNPCIKVIFRNKKQQTIDRLFFYKKDSSTNCPSEFIIANWKSALGLGTGSATLEEIQSKSIWIAVLRTEYFKNKVQLTKGGNPIVYGEVGVEFWPGDTPYEKVKENCDGKDPQVDKEEKPTGGYFYAMNPKANPKSFKGCDQQNTGTVTTQEEQPKDAIQETEGEVKKDEPGDVW